MIQKSGENPTKTIHDAVKFSGTVLESITDKKS
jgi:hypothetical protein